MTTSYSASKPNGIDQARLQDLAQRVPEPQVRRYLEESIRCFNAGFYNAAVVNAWCAVARYLLLVVRGGGYDLVKQYVDDKSDDKSMDLERLDGKRLYALCDKILDVQKSFMQNDRLGTLLHDFWLKRCNCAHPTDTFLDEDDQVGELIASVDWIVTRSVSQSHLKYPIVLECIDNKAFALNASRAHELVKWVADDSDRESLAIALLRKFLSSPDAEEEFDVAMDERIVTVWEALGNELGESSKRRLMEKLADGIETSKRQFDVVYVSRLVFWPEAKDYSPIWDFFDSLLNDDSMTRGIVARLREYAPSPYLQRAKAWPNLEKE